MDFLALLLSVEATRRESGSALPGAGTRPDEGRWRRVAGRLRRDRRADPPGGGEP